MINRIKEVDFNSEKGRLLDRALAHSKLRLYKEAIADCENLVALDKDDPNSYRELGVSYAENNQIDKAIECYRFAIKRFPDYHAAYTSLGHLFQEYKKRLDIALVCYEKALKLNPEDFWALHNIGTVLKKEQKIKEAFYYFQEAFQIAQAKGIFERKIIHNLAWALYRCKEYQAALYLYTQLDDPYSTDGSIHFELGCVNYRIGRFQDAVLQFAEALACQPGNKFYQRAQNIVICKSGIYN
ncbi:MAG: tetratricopeptide repeat protein [Candidatus Omnitrophota bacterium]